jgi:hypothetical protein
VKQQQHLKQQQVRQQQQEKQQQLLQAQAASLSVLKVSDMPQSCKL